MDVVTVPLLTPVLHPLLTPSLPYYQEQMTTLVESHSNRLEELDKEHAGE